MRRPRTLLLAAGLAAGALLLSACGSSDSESSDGDAASKGAVVVGSAGFTEIELMAEMYAALLNAAGFEASVTVLENRELYEPALEDGQLDVVPDYLATMTEFLNRKVNGPDAKPVASGDPGATAAALNELAGPLGLTPLEPARAANQNAFFVTQDFAKAKSLKTLSDLGALGQPITLAATEECPERPFCGLGLIGTYGLTLTEVLPTGFGSAQTKDAVVKGTAQLGLSGTTDATLGPLGLVVLTDDKGLQLADNLIPVVGEKYGDDADLAEVLNALSRVLTTDDLATLNDRVDAQREKAADVALDYLTSKGLL
jgi:osmoprotectant transport system substrate-binding protein